MVGHDAIADGDKKMRLRYAGTCRLCGVGLPARTEAVYERGTKTVRCVDCSAGESSAARVGAEPVPPAEPKPSTKNVRGVAGLSARQEYERRRAKDETRIRQRWGRLGGVAVALSNEKQSTTAWARGAAGEERFGSFLNQFASDDMAILHDCGIPGSRANIDHLIVTPAGVWVVDAKRYKGRPELRVEGGIIRQRVEKLMVNGRDRTNLVDRVIEQARLVRSVVGDVPVHGVLCFTGSDWPLFGGAFRTRDVLVLWPKRLAKLLRSTEGTSDVATVRDLLADHFRVS